MSDIETQVKTEVAAAQSTVKAYIAKYGIIVLVAVLAFIAGRIV